MLLAVDIGNTNFKTGLFKGEELSNFAVHDNFSLLFSKIRNIKFEYVAVSSVVPDKTDSLKAWLKEELNLNPFIITKDSQFSLEIDYETPETLGLDRICSAEGAMELCKNSNRFQEKTILVTIDFGTATTINIVNYPGIFLGGLIAAGINTMFNSLTKGTAQLPRSDVNDYSSLIAKSTAGSLASGVINSTLGMIEKSLEHIKKNFDARNIIVFTTGGNARQIMPYLPGNFILDETLVLKGIKSIYNLNAGS